MKTDLNVIAANLIHAGRTRENETIGGGIFCGDELIEAGRALQAFESMRYALAFIDLDSVPADVRVYVEAALKKAGMV